MVYETGVDKLVVQHNTSVECLGKVPKEKPVKSSPIKSSPTTSESKSRSSLGTSKLHNLFTRRSTSFKKTNTEIEAYSENFEAELKSANGQPAYCNAPLYKRKRSDSSSGSEPLRKRNSGLGNYVRKIGYRFSVCFGSPMVYEDETSQDSPTSKNNECILARMPANFRDETHSPAEWELEDKAFLIEEQQSPNGRLEILSPRSYGPYSPHSNCKSCNSGDTGDHMSSFASINRAHGQKRDWEDAFCADNEFSDDESMDGDSDWEAEQQISKRECLRPEQRPLSFSASRRQILTKFFRNRKAKKAYNSIY